MPRNSDDKPQKQQHRPPASSHSSSSREPIACADYYRLNAPFRLWLRKEKRLYFDELTSDQARSRFASFVHAWNSGRLRSRYYDQDPELAHLSKSVLTRHTWAFAASTGDRREMGSVNGNVLSAPLAATAEPNPPANAPAMLSPADLSSGSARLLDEEQRSRNRLRRKRERRDAHEREQLILDEVAPRETGHEAKIAKRRAINHIRHAEPTQDVEIADRDIYASPAQDLVALKRERDIQERRRQDRRRSTRPDPATRLRDHIDKEHKTVELLRAMAQQSRIHGLGMLQPPQAPRK
ncbi:hypothetical protein GGI04_001039 [Coemansia thaxteri]|uniref:Uncharacterized protein n=1 Tax=Coemansia thaxteri TaxID=2663907 RepID=A0A9W8EGK8_9FUNG|nr:hypothetical protein H4R26_001476 [Coemansia thaxteri]KAJ2008675.1 hypothetical protein GGI04_001039 [Coemansia thaxteri]KAJ2472459.1 hypothetical protein GGI02_001567 [Coemansia sp. RSA 2322]KAJ2488003.1 hypothetical protein EV174_000240 [Coemansia sp. RSA 2320]